MFKFEVPDFNVWNKLLNGVVADLKKTQPSLRLAVANVAADLARKAPPSNQQVSGASVSAKRMGERSVASDISRTFKPVESLPFAQLVKSKNWSAVADYNFQFDSPSLAKAYKSGKYEQIYSAFIKSENAQMFSSEKVQYSKVAEPAWWSKQRSKKTGRVKQSPNVLYVKESRTVTALISSVKQSVGKMVGGWTSIAKALGYRGSFSWAGNQSQKGSYKEKTSGKGGHEVTINNPNGNFNNWMDRNGSVVKSIVNNRMAEYRRAVKKVVDESLRNSAKAELPTKPVPAKK